jgi:hypothetical protein
LLSVPPVSAQSQSKEEQIVLWPWVTDGLEYRRVAYPRQADTIRVIAETPIVVEARRTQVYFWPLTREYLADFSTLNEPVPGQLEIVSSNGEVRRIASRRYTLWHPEGVAAGRSELLFDEVAEEVYAAYQRDSRAAAEAARGFEQRRAANDAQVEAWVKQAAAKVQPLPPPPPEFVESPPRAYVAYASEIQEAPVVSLPPGEYRAQWRLPDGTIASGSERRLVSFAARRQAIGYRILPESRWTQPTTSYSPDEALYVTGDDALFLQPVAVEEYNASHYVRLLRPQTLESPDPSLHFWVPRGPLSGAALGVWQGNQPVETVPELPYQVTQAAGAGFGYEIEEFKPGGPAAAPEFVALRLPTHLGALSHLSLTTPDGAEIPNSRREVRRVQTGLDLLLYAPAVLPLALATLVRFRRQRLASRRSEPA